MIRRVRDAYLADSARVLGDVVLGVDVSIWYGVSIRGDVAKVTIGDASNVQDNAVIHCDTGVPNEIGKSVSIGHGAVVHGASVGDGTLIGMNATVLGRCRIGTGCLIAAGAVVPPGLEVPDGMLVVGVPGKILRPLNEQERGYLQWLSPNYIRLAKLHAENPDDPRVRPYGAAPDEG